MKNSALAPERGQGSVLFVCCVLFCYQGVKIEQCPRKWRADVWPGLVGSYQRSDSEQTA